MRKLKLWNHDKSSSITFDTSILATNVSGLGINFKTSVQNGKIIDLNSKFEDIKMTLIYGVESNAYTEYRNLVGFIANNGRNKFIFEYSVNGLTLFAGVYVKVASKSEKTSFNVLQEPLVLERVSNWYQEYDVSVPSYPSVVSVDSKSIDDILIKLVISGATTSDLEISLLDDGDNIIKKTKLLTTLNIGESLLIDSENKKVILSTASGESNAYNLINKEFNTFMNVPFGNYSLSVTAGSANSVDATYKKWVI